MPTEKTVRVRIEGCIDPEGRWWVDEAWSGSGIPQMDAESETKFVIVADVPVPEEPEPTEVEGEVENG